MSATTTPATETGTDALVLAGGVAKGAFTAGVLRALVRDAEPRVRRIVATSSGALNGVYLAAAVRDGAQSAAGDALVRLWREEATLTRAFDLSVSGVIARRGLSTTNEMLALLRREIQPSPGARPIELRVILTNAAGELARVDGEMATTFEHVARFDEAAFATRARLEEVFRAVTASAAFPIALLPVTIPIDGKEAPCFDGGLVSDAPIPEAIAEGGVTRVFLITPYARVDDRAPDLQGVSLLVHLASILVHERLFRDLRDAYAANGAIARLAEILPDPSLRQRVLDAIGWGRRGAIEIVELRPDRPLRGGEFDGFFSRALRDEYIAAGEASVARWRAGRR